jgi:hypothetical protein
MAKPKRYLNLEEEKEDVIQDTRFQFIDDESVLNDNKPVICP